MKIKAYSKVNLCLKVFKKGNQEKHKIDSVLYLYKKIFDVIEIKKSDRLSIQYFYHGNEMDIQNCLIEKTMKYLKEKHSLDIKYNIKVRKNIPIGSGLGGGSSDAAAIINYLIKGKAINLNLFDIATNLGSDIPFFLSGYKIARVQGYGEYVSPIYNWKPKIVLHLNDIFVPTEKIFKLLDKDNLYKPQVNIDEVIKSNIYKQHINVVYNDLTKYIIESDKQLEEIYKKFANKGWFTGAGSTIVTLEE